MSLIKNIKEKIKKKALELKLNAILKSKMSLIAEQNPIRISEVVLVLDKAEQINKEIKKIERTALNELKQSKNISENGKVMAQSLFWINFDINAYLENLWQGKEIYIKELSLKDFHYIFRILINFHKDLIKIVNFTFRLKPIFSYKINKEDILLLNDNGFKELASFCEKGLVTLTFVNKSTIKYYKN